MRYLISSNGDFCPLPPLPPFLHFLLALLFLCLPSCKKHEESPLQIEEAAAVEGEEECAGVRNVSMTNGTLNQGLGEEENASHSLKWPGWSVVDDRCAGY